MSDPTAPPPSPGGRSERTEPLPSNVVDLGRVRAWRMVARRVEDLQERQAEVRENLGELSAGLRTLQGSMTRSLETLKDSQRLLDRMARDMRDCNRDCRTCTDVLDRGDLDEIIQLRDALLRRREARH